MVFYLKKYFSSKKNNLRIFIEIFYIQTDFTGDIIAFSISQYQNGFGEKNSYNQIDIRKINLFNEENQPKYLQ